MLLSPEVTLVGNLPGAFRGFTLRFEDFLLIVLFLAFLSRLAIRKEVRGLVNTPLYFPLGIFVLLQFISTWWGSVKRKVYALTGTFFILKEIEFFLIFFLVVNYVRERTQIRNFVGIFLLMTAIVGIYGFLQIGKVERVAAPFDADQPNTFGGFLVLMYACILGIFFYSQSPRIRTGMVLLGLLLFPPFLFTLSRSSYVGLVITFLVFTLLTRSKGLFIILVMLLFFSPWWIPGPIKERILYTFSGYRGYPFDSSTVSRFAMWKFALKRWWESPILGNGVTGVKLVDNHYIRVLGESGILGLVAFLWILFTIFRCAWYIYREGKDRLYHYFSIAYLSGFCGILLHAFTTNTFYIVRIMEPFWFLTGVMMSIYLRVRSRKEGTHSHSFSASTQMKS